MEKEINKISHDLMDPILVNQNLPKYLYDQK